MNKHFRRELEQLTRDILVMGGLAETAVSRAVRSYLETDAAAAESVIEGDAELNAMELRIEEEVLKILSLYAPTARDLRYVVGVFKITNDLERVGDLAANIAERAKLGVEASPEAQRDIADMAKTVLRMFRESLDSFVKEDRARAEQVLDTDDQVDSKLSKIYDAERKRDAGNITETLRALSVAKHLERIADHATNIAEDVIYMVSGDVVKHQY